MDDLRRYLKEAFDKGQSELGDVSTARDRLVRNALAARDEPARNRMQLAAGIAAIVLTALIVGTFAYVKVGTRSHPVPAATPNPNQSPAPSPKAGVVVIDADPLDAATGWILLSNCLPPTTNKCHYSVARTADGGLTFTKAVQVGPSYNATDGSAPRAIHFVNSNDGFVYGGAAGFVTHDGGRTWGAIGVKAVFYAQQAVAGRGNRVWLLTNPCAKGTLCPYEVRSSVDGGRTWSAPYSLPVGFSPLDAVAFADGGLLVSSVPAGDMELTLDGGATWTPIKSRCDSSTFRAVVATADGNELWEGCLPNLKSRSQQIFVSEDGGKSWSLRAFREPSSQPPPDYSTILVSPRAGTAITASDQTTISITHDGGMTWTQVGGDGLGIQTIKFADATNGWALDVNQMVWATTDGGDQWSVRATWAAAT